MEAGHLFFAAWNVCKARGSYRVTDQAEFGVRKGEVVRLPGEKGAGQSTLVKTISGVENSDKEVGELSGRPKQALAITRAIRFKKPTSTLPAREIELLPGYIVKLRNDGVSRVLVTHNLYRAWQVCNRFVVMNRGKKIADVKKQDTTLEQITEFVMRH